MQNLKRLFPFVLILAFPLIFLIPQINKPLVGHHDWNSVVYSASGRSLAGKAETTEFFYQRNYPLGLPASLAASFLSFGINEFSVRLVPIFFTFLAAFMLYLLTKELIGKKTGLVAALLYLNTPLIRYFGKIPIHETVVPFFALWIFYRYWFWFQKKTLNNFLWLLFVIFLGQQFGWPSYFPVPLITIHYFLFTKEKRIAPVLSFWMTSILSFLLFLMTDYLILGKIPLAGLFSIFITRMALNKEDPFVFTWAQFLKKELLWIRVYATRALFLLSLIGIGKLFLSMAGKKIKAKQSLVFFLLIFGVMYLFIFRQASWLHDYVIIYLFPFLTIMAAEALLFLSKKLKVNYLFLVTFLLIFMFLESRQYLIDLEKANDFYPGLQLGKAINQLTQPEEKAIFLSKPSSKKYGPFFYFYANRSYEAREPSLEEFMDEEKQFQEKFEFMIIDNKHQGLSLDLKDYLYNNYQHVAIGQFDLLNAQNQ